MKRSLAQNASAPLTWLLLFLVAVVLLTTLGPSEKTLGSGVRIVYLHGAWVWTALAAFMIAGVAGLVSLITRKTAIYQWSTRLGLDWTADVGHLPAGVDLGDGDQLEWALSFRAALASGANLCRVRAAVADRIGSA